MPPGDYVDSYLYMIETYGNRATGNPIVTADIGVALRQRWGLDKPLPIQYLKWMSNVVRGEFGMSMVHAAPIRDVLGERILMTVILAASTIMFTWVMAIPIDIYSAVRQRSVEDYTFTFLGFVGLAVPDFMLALVIMYFAFVWFDFDVGGLFSISVVLSLPTVGPLLLQSLVSEDMFLAGTIILFLGLLTVVGTLLSDLLLVIVDPRIKPEGP